MKFKKNYLLTSLSTIAILVLVVLGGCVTTKQRLIDSGLKPLTTEELEALFAEEKEASFTTQKTSGTVKYYPDRTQKATWPGGNSGGTYFIEDGKFCSKLDIRAGAVKCTTWFKVNENTYTLVLDDGSKDASITFK